MAGLLRDERRSKADDAPPERVTVLVQGLT